MIKAMKTVLFTPRLSIFLYFGNFLTKAVSVITVMDIIKLRNANLAKDNMTNRSAKHEKAIETYLSIFLFDQMFIKNIGATKNR